MTPMPSVLRDYALLADGERGALIGPTGVIAWLCFPGWADPAVLASLIGGQGTYAITPRGRYVWGGSYEPGSLIWRSRWVTEAGIVECREALAFPGDPERAVILRRVQAVAGEARLEVVCGIAGDYGRVPARRLKCEDDVWHGQVGDTRFAWHGSGQAAPADAGGLQLELKLAPGETHDFVLALGGELTGVDPDAAWSATESAWKRAVPEFDFRLAHRDARHARAVLRGLTSSKGGMVAAATMALPERARQGRSYDYRYAWVRDQAMAGQAAACAGAEDILDSATGFLRARLLDDGPNMAPAYTVAGGRVPDEEQLGLPGYPGGTDVVGNHANEQFQLDAFGEALLCFAAADTCDRLDADGWRAVQVAARAIEERRHDAGAGIWELDDAHWTHSRLICAAGLRQIARRPTAGGSAGEWLAVADDLVATAGSAIFPTGRWQRSPQDDRIDAALLFGGIRGATEPDDPRALATIAAVEDELCDDFFAYRFRPDARPLEDAEGAFLLCGFTMALALDACGRHVDAAHWFERNRGACGPPGLLSEEFDVSQRQLRGNLPQAFVHALLLECAATLSGQIDHQPEDLP